VKDVLLLVNIQLQHELNLTWPTPAWGANSASDLLAFVAPAGRLHKGADRKVRPLAFRLASGAIVLLASGRAHAQEAIARIDRLAERRRRAEHQPLRRLLSSQMATLLST
jgi:hypothetical protein